MSFVHAAAALMIFMSEISLFHSLTTKNEESWQTKLRYNFKVGNGKQSSAASLTSIDCLLTINNTDVVLNLVENEYLTTEPPVFYVNNDGRIAKMDVTDAGMQKPKYLQDTRGRAAVTLWKKDTPKNGVSSIEIEGVIFHGNESYQIRPIKSLTTGIKKEPEYDHELRKTSVHNGVMDYVLRISSNRASQVSDSPSSGRRGRSTASTAYEVDLLYVLDYSTYQKFSAELSFNGSVVGPTTVVQQMRYYYAQVSNLVDLRYKSITTASYTIRAKLTAFYIVMGAASSTWTESISVSAGLNGWNAVNASESLSLFTEWIYGASGAALRSSLPSFDHAVLFTAYDLYSGGATGASYGVIGMAYLEGICTSHSSSIVENTGALTEASTCAHELGHSLGAVHDGEDNLCQASDQYIMSAVSRVATGSTSQNYFRFSSCSVANFTSTIFSLINNCLSDSNNYFNSTEWNAYNEIVPGQIYSPNALCRQAYGNSFEACGGVKRGSEVCLSIYCYNSSLPVSTSVSCTSLGASGRGVDGTTCGNHRWCQQGTCTYNTTAPPAFDDCPIGDYARNSQVYSDVPYVCSNMPSRYCYYEHAYNSCCATCNMIKDNSRPGCEYGDLANCSGLTQYDCPLNLDLCCRTCDAFISRPLTTTLISTSGIRSAAATATTNIALTGTSISTDRGLSGINTTSSATASATALSTGRSLSGITATSNATAAPATALSTGRSLSGITMTLNPTASATGLSTGRGLSGITTTSNPTAAPATATTITRASTATQKSIAGGRALPNIIIYANLILFLILALV